MCYSSGMDAFTALADPVRRDILDLLRSGERDAGSIAARFPISRPAISRHLRVLREAGLVTVRLDGRNRIYRLQPQGLGAVDRWLAPYREASEPGALASGPQTWDMRLDALETEVFRTRRDRRTAGTASQGSAPNPPDQHEEQSA